ncbi:MAG: retropepsin-like aspartic protease [Bacteroidetes bacterium]|nr:retropepsin-like aspartic protease [Bacteroidota bacterium]
MKNLLSFFLVMVVVITSCKDGEQTKSNEASGKSGVILGKADPVTQVIGFFNDIMNQKYENAFARQNNELWKPFEKFKSVNGYGGITTIEVYDAKLVEMTNTSAQVYLQYFAADPHNKDGIFKQYFMLNKIDSNWIIVNSTVIRDKRTIYGEGSGTVNFTRTNNGQMSVPVVINNTLKINFILDSGASEVNISSVVLLTLIQTGTVDDDDYLGTEKYKLANGSIVQSHRFLLKTLQIGNFLLENIPASVSDSINSPMLLGQNVLNQFGKITIDQKNNQLIISQ